MGRPRAPETGRVERLAPGGAGVVRLASGKVELAVGVAPGELVELTIKDGKPSVLRIVEAGPDRVEPPCPYVARCGGCDWMHIREAAQLREHVAIVRDVAAHALGSARVPEIVAHPSRRALAYRTRARLFVRARGGAASIGYRSQGSRDMAAVDACAVLAPSIAPMLGELAALLAGSRGEGDALVVRGAGGLPVVDLAFRGELPGDVWSRIDARVASGAWAGARILLEGVSRPASFGDPRPVVDGADGRPLLVAAGGFAQPSDEAFAELALRVADLACLDNAAPTVLELFAGSGALSIVLAPRAKHFSGIEIDADAVAALRENFAVREIEGQLRVADANATPIPRQAGVVVLDPPRTGALGAARALAASRARSIVYVACDPPTLARDLAILTAAGFSLTHLETFELFPQTSHVETVARLVRERG